MRILLIHPEDTVTSALWTRTRWNRVIDGGAASSAGGVEAFPKLWASDFQRIRKALAFGSGALIDSKGIDWWDLLSIEFHQSLEKLQVLRRVAATVDPNDEVFATRPGSESRILHAILGREPRYLSRRRISRKPVPERLKRLLKFRPREVVEILGDKYDSGYRLRRIFSAARPRLEGEVVLAPSSYVNVSRGAAAYASEIPETEFLLVATRASGLLKDVPRNMHTARLSCYASPSKDQNDVAHVLNAWKHLEARLAAHEDWSVLNQFGILNSVPSLLRNGMRVRDAWWNVFESVKVRAVLCGDEMNPFTRLPVCMAKQRGITALAFHHGALDGRYRYRDNSADLMLAKSQMELDYLVRECGVAEERIALVATGKSRQPQTLNRKPKSAVVFFSEPYEIAGVRCRDVYQQVLPGLRRLARERSCELVLKLHPQENRRQREPIAAATIGTGEFRMIDGPLLPDLLGQTQFAVTVSSTAAVECSQLDIPAFLCSWLDRSHYGYGEQFVKFGVAIPLRSPEEIATIPELVGSHAAATQEEFCDSGTHGPRFRQLLTQSDSQKAVSGKVAQPAWA